MKVLLDIPDSKTPSLMEVLKSISYVKAKTLTDNKAQLMEEIREAVEEMKSIRAGKKKARNAEDFIHDLSQKWAIDEIIDLKLIFFDPKGYYPILIYKAAIWHFGQIYIAA